MHKITLLIITLFAFTRVSNCQDIKVKVFNPSDEYPSTYSPEFAGKPMIYDFVKPLVLELQQPKDSDFISAAGAGANLKWRLESVTIISPDLVAVSFTEGHVIVIGVFVRNTVKNEWELSTEVGGHFATRVYDEVTGESKKANKSEQATPRKPSD